MITFTFFTRKHGYFGFGRNQEKHSVSVSAVKSSFGRTLLRDLVVGVRRVLSFPSTYPIYYQWVGHPCLVGKAKPNNSTLNLADVYFNTYK